MLEKFSLEQIFFYIRSYQEILFYSSFYFLASGMIGIFLILRKSSLFGLALTEAAQISFILSFAFVSFTTKQDTFDLFNQARSETVSFYSTLTHLDQYFFPIIFLFISILVVLLKYMDKNSVNLETFFAILLVVFTACISLLYKGIGAADQMLSKAYFSEILYTPAFLFKHYLVHLAIFSGTFFIFHRHFLLTGFNKIQATVWRFNIFFWDILFYIIAGGVLAVCVRVMGIYLTMASFLIPGYIALKVSASFRSCLILTPLFSILFAYTGFLLSFYFDFLPTEPILIITFAILATIISLVKKSRT